jgi:pimeloyl-ACP methyl ester carboxylesterase
MDIVGLVHSRIDESCPRTSLSGFFETNTEQASLIDHEGRIVTALNHLINRDDTTETLSIAAILELNRRAGIDTVPGVSLTINDSLVKALCDLVITGDRALTDFRDRAVDISALRAGLRMMVIEALVDDPMAGDIRTVDAETVARVCDQIINRCLIVHWALHGPMHHRDSARPALGWLAVDAEHDTPTRPINVPGALWPTADSVCSVDHDGRSIRARVRFAIPGGEDAISEVNVLEALPTLDRVPLIPDDAMIMVFLHGHSSRLEEAGGIASALGSEFRKYLVARPLVVISFDFPTHGYSEYIDHDELSPYDHTTRYVPDRPEDRRFGILEYFEKLSIALLEQIDADARAQGQASFLERVVAFIGGSMGGNLALRLSERLVTSADWLPSLVAWSPASTYGSFGRDEGGFIPIPSPGEHVDIFGKEALDRTRHRSLEDERDISRADFIRLQLEGEQLINDGTDSFRFWIHALVGLFGPPDIAFQALTQGLTAGWVGAMVPLRQSDSWLRPACRASYNVREAEHSARLGLRETYNSARRRMHWRVANEQLLFSHQDEIAASRRRACFAVSSIPTLLIAGANDITDAQRFDIYNSTRRIAPQMRANAGTGVFVASTGHSIHAERPIWLSQQVVRFVSGKLSIPGTARLISAVRRDNRDRTTHLCAALSHWSPITVEAVIDDIQSNRFHYFVQLEGQDTPTAIEVIERAGSFFLRTETTPSSADNLDNLPGWSVRRLEFTFVTGGDNLRGGDDNLDIHVHLRDGRLITRRAVNGRSAWENGSVNRVEIGLPDDIEPDELLRIELETHFTGGTDGENWSMTAMNVRGIGDGFDQEVGYWGFMRFTGESRRLSVALNPSPATPGEVDRLFLMIDTGVDGLRGVNDNIALSIHYADGHTQWLPNINGGNEWASNSSRDVEILLDRPVTVDQLLRLQFEDSFSGGTFSDEWEMQSLIVRATGNNFDREVASHGYFRFTGSERILTVPISAVLAPPGHVDALRFEFSTGEDNLRGGDDNLNVWIEFADGRIEEAFNINNSVRWHNDSSTTVNVALRQAVLPTAIRLVRLTATFGGGHRGDNWNMQSAVVMASGSDTEVELVRHGFKRFTGDDRSLNLPIALAQPGEINVLTLTFATGGDNLRGGNDNLALTVRYSDGHAQLIENINGGARWINGSTHTIMALLERAVRPEDIVGLVIEAGFGGGSGGDNWNMQSMQVTGIGNGVELELVSYGFKRFRGDDNTLSIPIVVGPPGAATRLAFNFKTGGDNLRGDTDNLHATLTYRADDAEQQLFFRNVNGGERWHNHSSHTVTLNLPEPIEPSVMQRLDLETWFSGGDHGDNWDMEMLNVRVHGLELDQDLVSTGFKRFSAEDGHLSILIGAPGLVSALRFDFLTGDDNLRGDNDNVHAEVRFADGSSQRFLNINNRQRWVRNSETNVVVNLSGAVAFDFITGIELQTTFSGGSGGDDWHMAEVRVTALGNGLDRALFNHGFKRFTGDDQRLLLDRL